MSVRPDGLYAAVGHNGWISLVNLVSGMLENTLPVPADIGDVVLAGNGYMHAFPAGCCGFCSFYSIEVDTGKVFEPRAGATPWCGKVAQLHLSGEYLYSANPGHHEDLEKFSIQQGPSQPLYGSPVALDLRPCGDLWISEDGLRIFTACGNVFRASDIREQDMIYNGSLEGVGGIEHLDHSASAGLVAVISKDGKDTEVRVHNYEFLVFEKSVPLPEFMVEGKAYASHGRFVFFNQDGSAYHVIVQADARASYLADYGVVTFTP